MKRISVFAGALLLVFAAAGADASWIQRAIDACAARGGGCVTVPPGRYLVASLEIRSNVELHLERGAVLEGKVGMEHYRRLELPYSEGAWMAVVQSVGTTNVALTGEGEVYGNGRAWPIPEGPRIGPSGKRELDEGYRPRGIFFADAKNVRVEGVRLTEAACWGLVFKRCEDVFVRNILVDSMANANSDGVDIEAKNFTMVDSEINSGDDAVVFKSNDPNFTMEHVFVSNVIARSHLNDFKIGTATHGTVRKLVVTDCRGEAPRRHSVDRRWGRNAAWLGHENFRGAKDLVTGGVSTAGIVISCVDGGTVEDIVFRNLNLDETCVPIFVRGDLRTGRLCGTPPSSSCVLRRILLENITARAESFCASSVTGCGPCRPTDVTFRNVRVVCKGGGSETAEAATAAVPEGGGRYPDAALFADQALPAYGLYLRHADAITLDQTVFELAPQTTDSRPDVVAEDAQVTRLERNGTDGK